MGQPEGMLSGMRVIDLATERAEMAGRVFSDLGAEVIKVEPPGGCRARTMGPFAADGREPASLYWAAVGLGKRSVILDLAQPAERETLRRLAAAADVLIESFDPGYLPGLGLGYDELRVINPRLVFVSVTPYGQDGPNAHDPAGELVLEAASARATCQGDPDRPPAPLGYPQTAFHAGVQAAGDAILALYERERSGLGQYLDVSTQAVMVWTLLHSTGYPALGLGDAPGSGPNRANATASPTAQSVGRAMFEVADGWCAGSLGLGPIGASTVKYLMEWAAAEGQLSADFQDVDWRHWQLAMAEGKLDLARMNAAFSELWAFLKTKNKRELMDRASRDQLFIAPVYTMADVAGDPHLDANAFWIEVDGRRHPGAFARLSRLPMQPCRPAPALGEAQLLLKDLSTVRPPAATAGDPGAPRRGILEGVKVADFSWLGVGPITGKALADHGATVVRIESEIRPELLRQLPPFADGRPGLNRSQFYANFNSSKLGLALNLQTTEGRQVARQVVDWADVVLESFRPGAMARLGLDYETLARERPDLIMYSTCIRGQIGPERYFPGTGAQGAALCGMGAITGWPDRPPCNVHGAYTDVIVPRYGVALLASALINRDRTGLGQHIDMAQVEPGIKFLEPLVLDYTVNGRVAAQSGQESLYSCPRGIYPTVGVERYVAVEVETVEQWRALRSVASLEAFADPALDALDARMARRVEIDRAVAVWCKDKRAEDVAAQLKAAGVPAAAALFPSELFADPQLAHRGFFVPLTHSEMGEIPYDGVATRFSATPARLRKAAPCLGEDTHFVLHKLLGLSEEEMAAYAAADVLR